MEAYTVTGVAKALLAFYRTVQASGAAQVSLATFVRGGADSNAFIETIRQLGFPIHVIRERGVLDRGSSAALRDLIARERPDIVETHAVKSHTLLRFIRPKHTRWVAFHHGYTSQDFKMRVYNRLNPWALRGADQVVTVCHAFKRVLVREGVPESKIAVVANAIEPFPAEAHARTAIGTILSIGRLSAEKGHRYLIAAADLLRRARTDLSFEIVMVGDGPERARLTAQAAELRLNDAVRFAGQQSDPLPFYAAADAFVLPSLTEGSPLVLLEAMMARAPVVASKVGGIPETVADEESALLVPPADSAALARALERVLTDAPLAVRLRENALAAVTTRHTPEAYTATLLRLYRDVLARGHS